MDRPSAPGLKPPPHEDPQPTGGDPPTPELTRLRRHGPVVLIGLMLLAAIAIALGLVDLDREVVAEPRVPLLLLAGCWVAFELVVLYVQVGKDVDNAEQITVTEVVVALGLLFATPTELVLVGVVTPLLVDLVRGRKPLIKEAFNAVNRLVEMVVALAVFQAIAPPDPLSTEGWAALCVAVLVSALVSALDLVAVITLAIGRLHRRDLVRDLVSATAVALAGATVAFVVGLALQSGSVAVAPLLGALVLLLALVRGFSVLTDRHVNLATLHALGSRLADSRDQRQILVSTLETVAELLIAREVVAYLPVPQDPDRLVRVRIDADGTLDQDVVPAGDVPTHRGLLRATGTIVAAAPLAPGQAVVLAASGRAEPMRAFTQADARLLAMVAHHAGPNLYTAQLIEQLRIDSVHDAVTGLLNRDGLLAVARAQLVGQRPAVLVLVDIDTEVVIAALGHARGDELLVQVGRRLVDLCADVTVGRVGGQEFALLLPTGAADVPAADVAATVLASLEAPFLLSGVQVLARATLGVADTRDDPGVTAEDLLRHADVALRSAQRTGVPMEHYAARLTATSAERLALVAELQSGIARGELVLHAQPQVRLSDGALVGVEMLVRWNHPRRGLLFPGDFVPLAEQTGLDRALTAWVLETSLRALAAWRSCGLDLTVSVNVSTGALCDRSLPASTQDLLDRYGVAGHCLVIEMTESALLTNTSLAAEVLQGLSALGVRVSIDDFGTGFSSLSHLQRLPVDEIKIDQGFVGTMLEDDDDAAIVRSVIELGTALSLSVVAEGIEDERVYHALRALGCDVAQGYLVARPMPIGDVAGWAADRRALAHRSSRSSLETTQ